MDPATAAGHGARSPRLEGDQGHTSGRIRARGVIHPGWQGQGKIIPFQPQSWRKLAIPAGAA